MIIDKISNLRNYIGTVKHLEQALEVIEGKGTLPLGKHLFEGGWVLSTEGSSGAVDSKKFEAHRRYADVMVVLEYDETVCYLPTEGLAVAQEYDSEQDCALFDDGKEPFCITVPAGYFYVMMPDEGHKPCVHLEAPKQFRKYIVKCLQE